MRIKHVYLEAGPLDEVKAFYRELFPITEENRDSFTLLAGETAITFTRADGHAFYHFAFGLDEEAYRKTIKSLDSSVNRLKGKDGRDEFLSGQWKRTQVYYPDPAGNLIEVMQQPETSRLLEIVMPVHDVQGFSREAAKSIPNDYPAESETFAFFEDGNGVFVVTKEGRPWFPVGIPSEIHPITVALEAGTDERTGRLSFPGLPYTILLI